MLRVRTALVASFAVALVWGCNGDDGSTTGADGTGTTGVETDDVTETGSDTSDTGGPMCDPPEQVAATFTVELGEWPSESGIEPEYVDYTIDATCVVTAVTPEDGGELVELDCTDPLGMQRPLSLDVSFSPSVTLGVTEAMTVQFRFIRDSWHDVTQFGEGDWVELMDPADGRLILAAMDGRAEFLQVLPNLEGYEDWYAPLTIDALRDVCEEPRRALEVGVDATTVTVPEGGSDVLPTADGDYVVTVEALRTESQGPEYPSVSTFAFSIAQTGR